MKKIKPLYIRLTATFSKERAARTDDLFKLRAELDKETDRGCCMMAGSFLEQELGELLAVKLVGSKKFIDSMLEFNGPLGSFSARIKMAYALGLICHAAMSDLDTIRKIRNEFAHKHQSINFNTEALKKRIYNLKGHLCEIGESEPRRFFTNCTVGLVAQIHNALFHAPSFTELPDFLHPIKEDLLKRVSEDPGGMAADLLNHITRD
jgi:hypothetical protein